MRLYCLAYDAKDSDDSYDIAPNKNGLKESITEMLEKNGATNLDAPVATTILFGSKEGLNYWNKILTDNFDSVIYFFLCIVAESNEDRFFYRMHPDAELEHNFKKTLSK